MGFIFKKKPKRNQTRSIVENHIFFHEFEVEVQRRTRRRTSLSVQSTGKIVMKCALSTSVGELTHFFKENEEWLKKHLTKAKDYQQRFPPKEFKNQEKFPLLGEDYSLQIRRGEKRSWKICLESNYLVVNVPQNFRELYGEPADLRAEGLRQIRIFYRARGKQVLAERLKLWSEKTRLFPSRVGFRSQKTLWGSCNSKGHISLNWRMVAFPQHVFDYVIVHELCHLVHPDHSRFFWELVRCHYSEFEAAKKWLKLHQNSVDFLGA